MTAASATVMPVPTSRRKYFHPKRVSSVTRVLLTKKQNAELVRDAISSVIPPKGYHTPIGGVNAQECGTSVSSSGETAAT
jgi:hypothetical protein